MTFTHLSTQSHSPFKNAFLIEKQTTGSHAPNALAVLRVHRCIYIVRTLVYIMCVYRWRIVDGPLSPREKDPGREY